MERSFALAAIAQSVVQHHRQRGRTGLQSADGPAVLDGGAVYFEQFAPSVPVLARRRSRGRVGYFRDYRITQLAWDDLPSRP